MREKFTPERSYPARLLTVETRPLENKSLVLLRLEFEIFLDDPKGPRSLEKIACRDIVVGKSLNLPEDKGVARFFRALRLRGRMDSPEAWKAAERDPPWVRIQFGPVDQVDQRNPFASIVPFDAVGLKVVPASVDLKKGWVKVGAAAEILGISKSSVIRSVNKYEPEHGASLVRRSRGGHREINLKLLRELV